MYTIYTILVCMYNLVPEDEPSDWKHVEELVKIKFYFNRSAFYLFILYNYIILHSVKEHTKNSQCLVTHHPSIVHFNEPIALKANLVGYAGRWGRRAC